MAISTQDLVAGIDITALSVVSGSELNQLVDVARTAANTGLVLNTVDTSPSIPDVPNPNANYSGVIPVWWVRYIWLRKKFDSTSPPILYAWDDNLASDPTYLKWRNLSDISDEALVIANQALANAATAQLAANSAQTTANQARVDSGNIQDQLDVLLISFQALQESFNTLSSGLFPAGTLLWSATASGRMGGWLICDGTAISRIVYADLFAVINTTYGVGDGVNTFNLPDARGRSLIGNGTGSGLSARTLGAIGGEETHLLTGTESGLPAHSHTLPAVLQQQLDNLQNGPDGGSKPVSVTPITTNVTGPVNAANPHNTMMPFLVCALYIKY